MKFKNISYLIVLVILFSSNHIKAQVQTCNIEIEVLGLKSTQGQFMISINRGPEGWPEENFIEQRFISEFTAPNFTIIFENMPYGNYAVGVLHDKDGSGEMTSNFIGIPKEAFGFTRDYKVVFRAPKYHEANFDANSPVKKLKINLQH